MNDRHNQLTNVEVDGTVVAQTRRFDLTDDLTFRYGEAPEDVIRERHLELCEAGSSESLNELDWLHDTYCDQLILMLAALRKAGDNTRRLGDRVYQQLDGSDAERKYGTIEAIDYQRGTAWVQFDEWVESGGGGDVRTLNLLYKDNESARAFYLRILAALGITEGGAADHE